MKKTRNFLVLGFLQCNIIRKALVTLLFLKYIIAKKNFS